MAVQVTGVVPTEKDEPEAGVQLTVGLGSQLSVTVGVKVTTWTLLVHAPDVIFAGQVIVGGVVSTTLMVWLAVTV